MFQIRTWEATHNVFSSEKNTKQHEQCKHTLQTL